MQRRLTYTTDRKFPGIQGPRHWLRSSSDGSQVAFLMRDDDGIVQLWTVSPLGGKPRQVTRNHWDIASAFTWSPDGRFVAHIMDGGVCITEMASGNTRRLSKPEDNTPRPEACVFSPDGRKIAYMKTVRQGDGEFNQIFVCDTNR
jgi:Tol biopolymer transport system component